MLTELDLDEMARLEGGLTTGQLSCRLGTLGMGLIGASIFGVGGLVGGAIGGLLFCDL